jgi:hypothetical protein
MHFLARKAFVDILVVFSPFIRRTLLDMDSFTDFPA